MHANWHEPWKPFSITIHSTFIGGIDFPTSSLDLKFTKTLKMGYCGRLKAFDFLSKFSELRTLDCRAVYWKFVLSDPCIKVVSILSKLEHLKLDAFYSNNSDVFTKVTEYSNLNTLHIVRPENLFVNSSFPKLESLVVNLNAVEGENDEASCAAFDNLLEKMRLLKYLQISTKDSSYMNGLRIVDKFCKNLESLTWTYLKTSSAELLEFTRNNYPRLKSLDIAINGEMIDDQALSLIQTHCPNLSWRIFAV